MKKQQSTQKSSGMSEKLGLTVVAKEELVL